MEKIASAITLMGKAILALGGVFALWIGAVEVFEYGEGLGDLSQAEILFLVAMAAMEWRLVARSSAAKRGLRPAFAQFVYLGGVFVVLSIVDRVIGDAELPMVSIGLAILFAIHSATPKSQKTLPKAGVAA